MNFVLNECSHLKYYMPLIIEGNRLGIQSVFYIGYKGKYNCPSKHKDDVKDLVNTYNIIVKPIEDLKNSNDITFSVEANGLEFISDKSKKIVLTSQSDFRDKNKYPKYINKVDNVVMVSLFVAKYYGMISEKNLYLGSPKYDVTFNKSHIREKYSLSDTKCVLIISPINRCINQCVSILKPLYINLREMGYTILVKTRGKNPIQDGWMRGDRYFIDNSWFPHITMELIDISDIVINFNSTTVKEAIMGNTPVLNYKIEREYGIQERGYGFLYKYGCCIDNDVQGFETTFRQDVNYLTSNDWIDEFQTAKDDCLFKPGNVSKNIIEKVVL